MPKDPSIEPTTVKVEKAPAKIPPTRRESNRPIKKPKRDLLEEDSPDPVSTNQMDLNTSMIVRGHTFFFTCTSVNYSDLSCPVLFKDFC